MPTDVSARTGLFTESVIREMTRRALKVGAVNLAQGFPDFAAPAELKEAAKRAIDEDFNQYAITHGSPNFRRAIADKVRSFNGFACDPDLNVTVTCGATEAMIAAMLAVINPGDEVIIFEPFYENYGPDVILAGATPRYVALRDPNFSIDHAELEAAFGPRTKAIVINTPHNPSGKVFTRAELEKIAALCIRHDTLAITDEIYEHIIFGGARHVSIASLPGMADRTITISGLSKTYSITGWRLAYAIACERLTSAIRKVHDFLTVGAPHPLQEAGAVALRLPESFYAQLTSMYERKRAALYDALCGAGLKCTKPDGAYYIIAEIGGLGFQDDFAAAAFMLDEVGVAGVPGSSFYHRAELGHRKLRFTFSKSDQTIAAAADRLRHLSEKLAARSR
ncbi:MAG: aminotransferase class I/II-fold pyridoxal phosphate-dependent enzyme [Candidatus Binatus sp.]|uniref:pyridoxal phosphate-dependent aminotransferase n=1 Tax=Candidatus Binatus sp. TaxID=2811406 RepID=UPI00271C6879|nr:aminotransferase class I/II-fold pyridoxal phosphate-dependent enzyme [Candidatus Binatus sp.]MDO8431371.1 aminotransferase class I/II-fold pyridoxal phosphate-dependent enzyme [Candidatus Binatus sp.]